MLAIPSAGSLCRTWKKNNFALCLLVLTSLASPFLYWHQDSSIYWRPPKTFSLTDWTTTRFLGFPFTACYCWRAVSHSNKTPLVTCVCMYMCTYTCMYVCLYRERKRERESHSRSPISLKNPDTTFTPLLFLRCHIAAPFNRQGDSDTETHSWQVVEKSLKPHQCGLMTARAIYMKLCHKNEVKKKVCVPVVWLYLQNSKEKKS